MRVLVVHPGAAFSVADVHRGWCKGLAQCGATVADFNFHDRLDFYAKAHHWKDGEYTKTLTDTQAAQLAASGIPGAVNTFMPDLILIVSGFFVPERYYDLWRSQGIDLALLCTESPYEDDRQMERAKHFDFVLLNDPTNLLRFREQQRRTWYVPHAYDPDVHSPGPSIRSARSDFCFVGTAYPSRIEFFNAVDFGDIDVTLAGNWRGVRGTPLEQYLAHDVDACVENDQAVNLYRSTQASANIYRRESERPGLSDGEAMGPREVELAACGTFYLTEPRDENRVVLPMVPTFSTPDEFSTKLRWWLDHEDERADVALKAREAIAGRTFATHAAEFLRRAGY